ncbi:hypothetical protein AXX17_AT3G06440 [Arabidopsis thaliana]|uniref:Uncharacterized protein n=1 Tax=Arabidopsis thaliana TaxID=3702 RepID=A0A178VH00_ARATH|nr:hypothetical protein AXX17_AT3G06440 [Arabidopsis thaliana]
MAAFGLFFVECLLPATIYIRGSNKFKLLHEQDECVRLGELPDGSSEEEEPAAITNLLLSEHPTTC